MGSQLFAILMLFSISINTAQSAKILSISFMSSKSHKIVYNPLLERLAADGHQLTVVSPIKSDKQIQNITQVWTLDMEKIFQEENAPNMFEMRASSKHFASGFVNGFLIMTGWLETVCRKSYALPIIQQVLQEKYDLVLFTPLFNDCLYGLLHKLNTSVVIISQIPVVPWVGASFGSPSPPSFVSSFCFQYSDSMTYLERFLNFLGFLQNWLIMNFYYFPTMEKVYRDVFNDPNMPSIAEIEKNSSIILANSHISTDRPRPVMQDIIEVGGMAMVKAKPLPKDLEDFIAGAGDDGFILFSMGTNLKAKQLPEAYRKTFVNTFAKLKQRVLWKWEAETMPDLPPNVKLVSWLPQQDVLGHPKIRLFITHGGHGGTTEAIWNGVPLLGIPMFGDQAQNIEVAVRTGYAYRLEFSEINEQVFSHGINEVLQNPKYTQKAKELSRIFQDNVDNPLDRAVYWIEYVLRHKGAPHLRSAARDLNTFQYYSLDVIAGLLALVLVTLYINYAILRALLRKCCASKKAIKTSPSKKKQ